MKKIIFLFCLLSCAVLGFSQTTCPAIVFSYDASGNRISRAQVYLNCGGQRTIDTTTHQPVAERFQIKAYPNPAQDKITIEIPVDSSAAESKVTLVDMNGKTVYSGSSADLQMQIDVSAFDLGNYLLKISRGKKYATYNVVKVK